MTKIYLKDTHLETRNHKNVKKFVIKLNYKKNFHCKFSAKLNTMNFAQKIANKKDEQE